MSNEYFKNLKRKRMTGYRNCKTCDKSYLFISGYGQHNGESPKFCSKECSRIDANNRHSKFCHLHLGYQRKSDRKRKLKVLIHYGGDPPKCACCGERIVEFLCIDHINGGGNKHIKKITHNKFYAWIVRNNFPEGFQVLCYNCNKAKGRSKAIHCPVHHPEEY